MYSLHSDMIIRHNKLTGLKTVSVSRSRKTEELGIDTMRFNVCKCVIKQCNVQAEILKKKLGNITYIGSMNLNVVSNISDAFCANHC